MSEYLVFELRFKPDTWRICNSEKLCTTMEELA